MTLDVEGDICIFKVLTAPLSVPHGEALIRVCIISQIFVLPGLALLRFRNQELYFLLRQEKVAFTWLGILELRPQ